MKEIGGYFSLDLNQFNNMPHQEGVLLNSCRNALEYILRSIADVQCVYIPYFTCDTVLEPLEKLSINYQFYTIDEKLELAEEIQLASGEYLIYTNYFGIKDKYVKCLDKIYGNRLIVDNAQSLYAPATAKCAYSPRKYAGIPDGGIAFTDVHENSFSVEKDVSYDRCLHLLQRIDEGASAGYQEFRTNSKKLKYQPIREMSNLTKALISNIDFEKYRRIRRTNFEILHSQLHSKNLLAIGDLNDFECPLVYPYWVKNGKELKQHLIQHKVFVATYWPNVLEWCDEHTISRNIAENVLPLPIDQRYDADDMQYILNLL